VETEEAISTMITRITIEGGVYGLMCEIIRIKMTMIVNLR
jgi:hypothetical protein